MTIPKPCQQRHHNYGDDGVCAGCGKKKGTREPRALGAGGAGALRAALGLGGPSPQQATENSGPQQPETSPAAAATAVSPPPDPPKPRHRLWPKVAKRVTQWFDYATDAVIERTGRVPNDAEPEDLEDFEEALAEQLGLWFPDVAAGPKTRLALAGAFIVMEKRWNAEKIPPKAQPATVTSTPEAPTQPPEPPPEPNSHSAAPDAATTDEETLFQDL